MNDILLEAKNLSKSYIDGSSVTSIFEDVCLTLFKQEMIAVVGDSGSGKSSLLHILASLDAPTSGSVIFEGIDIFTMNSFQQARFRNMNLGFIYQFHHLLSEFTVLENVCIPAWIAGASKKPTIDAAKSLLDKVKMSHRLDYFPSQLSGGERQRVAIARALINEPKLLIADEPTGNLDNNIGQDIYELILSFVKERGVSFILVTHDLNLAAMMDRKYFLSKGLLAES